MNKHPERPAKTSGFHIGAFFMPVYFAWAFERYRFCWFAFACALLIPKTVIPILIASLIACLRGRRWMWEGENWSSVEEYESYVRGWGVAGMLYLAASAAFAYFFLL